MNRRRYLYAVTLTFAVAALALADETTDAFAKLMKPAAAANGALQKSLQADLTAAAGHAADVKAKFQDIEQFWAKRGTADAQTFAKNIQEAADKVAAAAKAGQKEEALAAAKEIGANCQGCHKVHRERVGEAWVLK